MPLMKIVTNIAADAVPDDFCKQLSGELAMMLEKPEERVVVHMMTGQRVCLGDPQRPVVFCTLRSIGKIGPKYNQAYVTKLCSFFEQHLDVSPDDAVIRFVDLKPIDVGLNGALRDK